MSAPTLPGFTVNLVGGATLRSDLMALVPEFEMEPNLIGREMFPGFPVSVISSAYPIFDKSNLYAVNTDLSRNANGTYKQAGYNVGSGTFTCTEYGIEVPVLDSQRVAYRNFFDADVAGVKEAVHITRIAQEMRIFNLLQGNISLTGNAAAAWDSASGTAITDVKAAKTTIYDQLGIQANCVAMSYLQYLKCSLNPEIRDRVKYTFPDIKMGELPKTLLAEAFGVKYVLVSDAVYNAGSPSSVNLEPIWPSNQVLVTRVAENPGTLNEACIGRTFVLEGLADGDIVVESYRYEPIRGDVIRARHYVDEALVFSQLGYWILDS